MAPRGVIVAQRRAASRTAACRVPRVEEQSAESKRRMRLSSPPIAFVGGLLLLAALIAAIIIVVWALGGFGEGSEGV
jgi:hypothetical protein